MTIRDASSSPRPRGFLALARRLALAVPAGLALASCGGDYGVGDSGFGLTCSVADQQTWLADYFAADYFWNQTSPYFPPQTGDVASYFQALLYTGNDTNFPGLTDTWSTYFSDDAFNRLYVDGQALGYGVFVAQPPLTTTLVVRYVDPGSPAATAGVARGDTVTSIDGVPAATVIATGDYSGLASSAAGETLTLGTNNAAGDHSLTLTSATYVLTPVQGARVVTTAGGRSMGYVMVTDLIDQALSPYDAAFAQFKAAGVRDVVVDLRYASAGTVHDGEIMASYPNGPLTTGQVYANLYFNADFQTDFDAFYTFDPYSSALGLSRVFVLTGPLTCGVAEQFVNGLSPYVTVVTIGSTTCGKPFGSTPASNCGTTYATVNFEVTNGSGQGRYFSGLAPTCRVDESYSAAIGSDGDSLLLGAEGYADGHGCPVAATTRNASSDTLRAAFLAPNVRRGAIVRQDGG